MSSIIGNNPVLFQYYMSFMTYLLYARFALVKCQKKKK